MRTTIRRILLDVGRPGQPLADALQLHRILSAGDRVLPDFLIIGVQRGGTTSLYNYLCEHTLVRPAYRKEVHFFDYNFDKGLRWYRSHFPRQAETETPEGRRCITGESSPYYIFHPLAAQRAKATIPDVRLIALLRNPVDRAISHYNLSKRNGFEKLSLEAALKREAEALAAEPPGNSSTVEGFDSSHLRQSYLRRGIYAEQLDRWLALFNDGQLLILRSEDLFTDQAGIVARAQEFLDLPDQPLRNPERFNEGAATGSVDPGLRRWLADFYRPHNKRLEELLDVDFGWD